MNITIGKWDIRLSKTLWGWDHFRKYTTESSTHYVLGKISLVIEDATAEVFRLCAECNSSEIDEVFAGDEGLTVCQSCGSVEQGYRYVNKRTFESAE